MGQNQARSTELPFARASETTQTVNARDMAGVLSEAKTLEIGGQYGEECEMRQGENVGWLSELSAARSSAASHQTRHDFTLSQVLQIRQILKSTNRSLVLF